MKYTIKDDGYIDEIGFGVNSLESKNKTSSEYTGTIPSGYTNLQEWALGEKEKIGAWKISENNLVFDNAKYSELNTLWEQQEENNRNVRYKELFAIENEIENLKEINKEQYGSANKSGKIISIGDALQTNPYINITNINETQTTKINLILTGKNMLANNAVTQTINGITFTQNEDRTITIKGTATENVEYTIGGNSTNTTPILVFKKDFSYYLTSNGLSIKMYENNGTEKSEKYSGSGGVIKFTDEDKKVTQIIVSIPKGNDLDLVLYPQLEFGISATEYEMYKSVIETIDLTEFVETPIVPSETLYPSDILTPKGTIIKNIEISNNYIYATINDSKYPIRESTLTLYTGYNSLYCIEDVNIFLKYKTAELNVGSLEFLQGKSTTEQRFTIRDDGSIEARDGIFYGDVCANNLYLPSGGKVIGGDGLLSTIYVAGTMMTSGGGIGSRPMGFYLGYSNATSSTSYIKYRDYMFFEFTIPKNFKITSAYVYVNHMPIIYKNYGTTKCTGYTRTMALYRATSLTSAKITYDQARGAFTTGGTFTLIPSALGSFTGSSSGLTRKKSINLKNYIYTSKTAEKYNVIKLQSNATCPTPGSTGNLPNDEIPLRKYTGAVNACLVITGYANI